MRRCARRTTSASSSAAYLVPGPEEAAQAVALGPRHDVGVQVRHGLATPCCSSPRTCRRRRGRPRPRRRAAGPAAKYRPATPPGRSARVDHVRARHHQHVPLEDRPVVEERRRRPASSATRERGHRRPPRSQQNRQLGHGGTTVASRLACAGHDAYGFETLAIHAGQEPGPADRRGGPADLPDLHLRAGRRRRAPAGLRVQPRPATRPATRCRSASPRWRAAGAGWPSPAAWPPRTPCCVRSAGPATTW